MVIFGSFDGFIYRNYDWQTPCYSSRLARSLRLGQKGNWATSLWENGQHRSVKSCVLRTKKVEEGEIRFLS